MGGTFPRLLHTASLWTLIVFGLPGPAGAKLATHMLLTDNAVLQQGIKVPVWGTTDSADEVKVSIAGQEQSAKPEGGKWRVTLSPLKAGGPLEMTITQGGDKLIVKNLLVGEVWLCGGQSNMQWEVHESGGAKEAIASAGNDKIRLFSVQRPGKQMSHANAWHVCDPDTVAKFSAVGYYFGRDLQKNLAVPIGLISSNLGGTTAERWMTAETLASNPDLKDMTAPQGKHDLYDQMIKPLAPFAIRGAIWYQGESNTDRAYHYRKVLPAMIGDWRKTFEVGDFPFLIVQLTSFQGLWPKRTEDWAELRESQLRTAQEVPNVAIAVTTDLGDKTDIHPQKKAEIGARLALIARAKAYGEKIEHSGPLYDGMENGGQRVTLRFSHVDGGLVADGPKLEGFTIAGEDKKFVPAAAEIVDNTVVVSSPEVDKPAAVRYDWQNLTKGNLRNKENLPASPFRTDDWPTGTQNVK